MIKKLSYLLRIFFVFFSFCCLNILCTYQVEAGVVGNIYSTDIMAYVDGVPIQSYNIGGKTAIVLEDLREYGFEVEWRQDIRKLFVKSETYLEKKIEYPDTSQIVRGKTGEIVGKIYSTDIVTIVNGLEVPSYNIGGKTVVCIEDLGNIDTQDNQNKQFGYSKYAMYFIWNQSNRTIHLNTFKDNRYELGKICKQYNITTSIGCYAYEPDFKYIDVDDMYLQLPSSFLGSKGDINHIDDYYKITLNGKEIESDTPLILVLPINYGDELNNTYANYNIDKLKIIFEEESLKNPFVPLTKEDIVKGIEKQSHVDILNRADIDNCIYLLCNFSTFMSGSRGILKIDSKANIIGSEDGRYSYDLCIGFDTPEEFNQKVIFQDRGFLMNDESDKVNLYYLNFGTQELHKIYSEYDIQILKYYPDEISGQDMIQIKNSKDEIIELKLSELLN